MLTYAFIYIKLIKSATGSSVFCIIISQNGTYEVKHAPINQNSSVWIPAAVATALMLESR